VVLCFNDCARSAEIFDIRVEHLRLEKGRLMFNIGRSKTDKVGYDSFVTVSEEPYSPGAFIFTQFPHCESNDSHWEVGLQKFPSQVARENELIYVKNICFSVYKIFKIFSSCRSHEARENELIYVKNSCFPYIKYLKNLAVVVAGEE
jgi:hypothetical protein